jgi:hypothetical protein
MQLREVGQQDGFWEMVWLSEFFASMAKPKICPAA